MKVKHCSVTINAFGKPEFCIELEPETPLEKDVMLAANYHCQQNHMDKTQDIMTAQTEIRSAAENKKNWGMRIWTSWQVSQQKYSESKK